MTRPHTKGRYGQWLIVEQGWYTTTYRYGINEEKTLGQNGQIRVSIRANAKLTLGLGLGLGLKPVSMTTKFRKVKSQSRKIMTSVKRKANDIPNKEIISLDKFTKPAKSAIFC